MPISASAIISIASNAVALSVLSARPASHGPFQTPRPWRASSLAEDSTFKEWSDRHGVPPNQRRLQQSAVGGDLKVCAPSSSFASPRLNDLIVCESGIGLS